MIPHGICDIDNSPKGFALRSKISDNCFGKQNSVMSPVQNSALLPKNWIPAFAGMTKCRFRNRY